MSATVINVMSRTGASPAARPVETPDSYIVELSVDVLKPANSPRSAEVDEHIQILAESDTDLPPILVHRETLRVIDGMHRLRAAERRGQATIRVRYFDGDEREAFVTAVRLNSAHGLPLTLADRKAAALRVMRYHPEWSDRGIAALVGLSDKTVGAIRRREGDSVPPAETRIGRDNECYPLNSMQGRLRASELFQQNPNATTREVAKLAEISATTAKDVRNRLLRGQDPVPPKQRGHRDTATVRPVRPSAAMRRAPVIPLSQLRNDPSLRFSDSGRTLLRWLAALGADEEEWGAIADSVPSHCAPTIAEMARRRAEDWREFATAVDRRAQRAYQSIENAS